MGSSGDQPNIAEAFECVPIAFCSVLVKREFMPPDELYVGESSRSTSSLAVFVFMSPQEAERFVDVLVRHELIPHQHIGVADVMLGPVIDCDGIEYVCEEQQIPPSWTAFRVPEDAPDLRSPGSSR